MEANYSLFVARGRKMIAFPDRDRSTFSSSEAISRRRTLNDIGIWPPILMVEEAQGRN